MTTPPIPTASGRLIFLPESMNPNHRASERYCWPSMCLPCGNCQHCEPAPITGTPPPHTTGTL